MVLQAKMERRQRRQSEKSSNTAEEFNCSKLSKIDITRGHPQSIPPPSEPVLPSSTKMLTPKAASGPAPTAIARQAVHLFGDETVPQDTDMHRKSPLQFTGDKSEARHSATIQKGQSECRDNYFYYLFLQSRYMLCVFFRIQRRR